MSPPPWRAAPLPPRSRGSCHNKAGAYFIHSSLRQIRHWSTTSTDRFWLVRAASILFRMVGPTGGINKHWVRKRPWCPLLP